MKTVAKGAFGLTMLTIFVAGLTGAGCGVDLSYLAKDGGASGCEVAEDCAELPHIECLGSWACADNTCVWNCTPEQGCRTDADCAEWASTLDVACAGHAACENGACDWVCDEVRECYSDADCPEGFECVFDAIPMPANGGDDAVSTKCALGLKCMPPAEGTCQPKDPEVGCQSDSDCPEGFHCEWPMLDTWEGDGTAGNGGASTKCAGLKCMPLEEGICVRDGECACYEIYDPVCGTDGLTYANDCFASCAGVGIAHWGECGAGCLGDADCGPGFRCQLNERCYVDCEGDGCAPDSSGETRPVCMGECVPVEQCRTDKDCWLVGGAPECNGTPVCLDGQCVWQCDETCFEDAECGPGMRCVIDACPDCPPNADCDGRCFGHCAPAGGCYSDYDCAPGEQCVFMPCDCMDEDGDGIVEDCFERCKEAGGFCQPAPSCQSDSDCGWGAVCVIDVCADCAEDAICEAGTECYCGCFGHCEQRPACGWDYDCGPGERCVIDTCPACPPDAVCIDSECYGHCEPVICKDRVVCGLYCEYGFKTDPNGCEICECNEPPAECETFIDPNGEVCTRCFNPDGSVTMSCGGPVCAMDQPACSNDMDCRGGAAGICMNGCCVFPGTCIETFAACKDDSMCPAGTACFDGACCYGLD
ncbi:MAG: hypothetical protein HY897_21900 [Deltaproteobacteria bacterium]|nr:hypothetical protein [Deltaproteobacteria bacterium]